MGQKIKCQHLRKTCKKKEIKKSSRRRKKSDQIESSLPFANMLKLFNHLSYVERLLLRATGYAFELFKVVQIKLYSHHSLLLHMKGMHVFSCYDYSSLATQIQ